jgi:hypothetical protein
MEPEAVKDGPEQASSNSENTSSSNPASNYTTPNGSASAVPEEGTISHILSQTIQRMRQKGLKMDQVTHFILYRNYHKSIFLFFSLEFRLWSE